MEKRLYYLFLAGLGAGVGMAMLLAPKSGPDARQYISNRVSEGQESLRRLGTKVADSAGAWVGKGKSVLTNPAAS